MAVYAVNNQEHQQLCVRAPSDFGWLADVHMLPLVLSEAGHAGNEYPVVFVQKEEPDQFQLVALFGLSPGENLFVDDGNWHGLYLPAIIQHLPFKLIPDSPKDGHMLLGIDTDSELVQETEGEALFDEHGKETEFLKARKAQLADYYQHDQLTRTCVAFLLERELLVAHDLKVTVNDTQKNIAGVHMVDEAKLNELPDEDFNELRRKGFLPFIYAHMLSMNQVHRLARLSALA